MRIEPWFLIFLIGCGSSHLAKHEKFDIEHNPPGTVKLTDSLYIDKTEVPNVGWREFVFYQQRKYGSESKEFTSSLLDSLVWLSLPNAYELSEIYFRHPSFNNYPAVGMSYEQAITFCKWRTDAVNQLLQKHPNGKYKRVLYRLPTAAEWNFAANNGTVGDTAFYENSLFYDKKGRLIVFCKNNLSLDVKTANGARIYTSVCNSFYPNEIGAYHLLGNVSEMLNKKGDFIGGNFTLPVESCKINQIRTYTKPEAWLGFRCVCEIIE